MESNNTNQSLENLSFTQSKDIKVSLFKNAKATGKERDIFISEYLKQVSGLARKAAAEKLQALSQAGYKKAKIFEPCITGSCVMDQSGRSLKNILFLNGLAVVDFDELPNDYKEWQEFKEDLQTNPFTFIVHYSLSGRGLCVFVKISIENNFKEIYLSLQEYYAFIFGAKIDFLADETRLRFIPYDPKPFLNENSKVYTDTIKETPGLLNEPQTDNFPLLNDPATAFNNSGLAGFELVNKLLTDLGYTITAGKAPTIYEYQRAGGSLKSMVAFFNQGVVKFQVFSANTGLKKESYNPYELYKELNDFGDDDYKAQKTLYSLGYGTFTESNKNVFPIEILPQLFRDYAIDLRETINYPVDYTGTAILATVATAAGANVSVLVKSGWLEKGSLFACAIGDAGSNKTHPVNTVFAPIKAIDRERHNQFKYDYDLYLSYEKLSKKDKDEAESLFCPILEKSVLSNFTIEILFKRLSENPRGCTVLSDELVSFLEGMNNYSKSDQIGFYLSVWSNQSITVDRVGQAIPLFISNPYLSIIGGLQPRALNKAFPPDKLNNGFFQRFLFAYPDEAIKQPLNDNLADENLARKYEAFINKLFEIVEPRTLTFTPEAKRYFYDWQANNCDRVNEHQNSIKGEILSKFDNHFIRLALLVQIMTDPESKEIEIEAIHAANALCRYFLNCSFKVLAKIQNKANYLESIPQEKQQLFNELEQSFTTAEATEIGLELGIAERTIKRFLQDTQLFKKAKHGNYLKNKIENE